MTEENLWNKLDYFSDTISTRVDKVCIMMDGGGKLMNLEEIKAREQTATPGPWEYVDNGFYGYIVPQGKDMDSMIAGGEPCEGRICDGPDTQFIAHARTDIPALIAEAERLTKENVALQCENNVLQGSFDRISVKGINMEEKYKQQIAMLKKALELEARHMVSLVSTSDCKMKENSEYCSSTISCTECIQQHFIKQAQQLTDGDASESGDPHV